MQMKLLEQLFPTARILKISKNIQCKSEYSILRLPYDRRLHVLRLVGVRLLNQPCFRLRELSLLIPLPILFIPLLMARIAFPKMLRLLLEERRLLLEDRRLLLEDWRLLLEDRCLLLEDRRLLLEAQRLLDARRLPKNGVGSFGVESMTEIICFSESKSKICRKARIEVISCK